MQLGIIGCGQMGRYYADILVNKLGMLRDEKVDIICHDHNNTKMLALCDTFGIQGSAVVPSDMDAAIVAVNTPAHADVIVKLLENGTKFILCEKPLGMTVEDVERIAHAVKGHPGAQVFTALVINFSPALVFLKKLMQTHSVYPHELWGTWGKPRPLDKNARPSAGDVEDESVHPISFGLELCQHMNRISVRARVGTLAFVARDVQGAARDLDPSFPETPNHSTEAQFTINDIAQVAFSVRSSFLLAKQERRVGGILGQRGTPRFLFEVSFDEKREGKVGDVMQLVDLDQKTTVEEFFEVDKLKGLTQSFVQFVGEGMPDERLADMATGGMLVAITEAILTSSRENCREIQI